MLFGRNGGWAVLSGIWRVSLWLGVLGGIGRSLAGAAGALRILWRAGLGRSAEILRMGFSPGRPGPCG